MKRCFKCDTQEGTLKKWKNGNELLPAVIVPHHISYNPEVIVDCCRSCHTKIHIRIRKQKSCSLSLEETDRLSTLSGKRRYQKNNCQLLNFYETLMPNVILWEYLEYNKKTGTVCVCSDFIANHKKELKEIEI